MQVALVGYGKMGQIVGKQFNNIVGIVSPGYLTKLDEMEKKPDVIVDFSHPDNLDMICNYAKKKMIPVVFGTTNYTELDLKKIAQLSEIVAVIHSSNFSLGIILMNRLVKQATKVLKDSFDIEIIEKHHNMKIDAPSGTAKMLMESINYENDYKYKYGRNGIDKREKKEIGIHSLRGGSIVGEHTVIYAGTDEVLEIKHEAYSKEIFARGAYLATSFVLGKTKGLYTMEDVLFGVDK